MSAEQLSDTAKIDVENIGEINERSVTLPLGVSIFVDRNMTNRTSFLHTIMAALGSDDVSLKGDADEGRVELTIDGKTYTRRLTRQNGHVTTTGSLYLEESTLGDLFMFLLESNEARRAAMQGDSPPRHHHAACRHGRN